MSGGLLLWNTAGRENFWRTLQSSEILNHLSTCLTRPSNCCRRVEDTSPSRITDAEPGWNTSTFMCPWTRLITELTWYSTTIILESGNSSLDITLGQESDSSSSRRMDSRLPDTPSTLSSVVQKFQSLEKLPSHVHHPFATDSGESSVLLQDLVHASDQLSHSLNIYLSTQISNPKLVSILRQHGAISQSLHTVIFSLRLKATPHPDINTCSQNERSIKP
jgi:hypothetical protein